MELTVITPVFNGQRFIESCLQSVINQNCPHVEHLIIDGGSTDNTLKIIKGYAARYPHIRWVSKKDKGQSNAMNNGIAMARGEIIGILNCDDYYEPNVLPRILEKIKSLPTPSFLVGNCHVLDDAEKITYINKPSRLSFTNVLIGGEFPFNPSAYFYHKDLHDKVGPYDESDHYSMDLDFLLRALQVAHIKYVDETWGNFRHIAGTKTFQLKETNHLEENKARIINTYINKLPLWQRWQIKMMRLMFRNKKVHYYSDRIVDLLKSSQVSRSNH